MKKIFTFLAIAVLIGSTAMAQDSRHGEYRAQSPAYQQDNTRGYANSSQNHGAYKNNDQVYRQDRGNGYEYNNERRYEDRNNDRGFHNKYPVYRHERMENDRYRRTRAHASISIVFGKRWR